MASSYYDRDARLSSKGKHDLRIKNIFNREVFVYDDSCFTEEERVEGVIRNEKFEEADQGFKCLLKQLKQAGSLKKCVKEQQGKQEDSDAATKDEQRPVFTSSSKLDETLIVGSSGRKRKQMDKDEVQAYDEAACRDGLTNLQIIPTTNNIVHRPLSCNQNATTEACLNKRKKIADIISSKLKRFRNEHYSIEQS